MDWRVSVIALLSLSAILLCRGADDPDQITSLPGLLKQPSFDMYSGYLNVSGTNKLHYWLVHSAHSISDPLIVWVSSGPGCSALYSLLTSNGPFTVQPDGIHLDDNPSSWNLNANLLYIDAPVGTGFSYAQDGSFAANDTGVTDVFFHGLMSFFVKYPRFKLNHIYLAGDGYAGVYVPLLMKTFESMSQAELLPFQGFAVGNALTSVTLQDNSFVEFAYYHGIIGESLWENLNMSCCSDGVCNFHNNSKVDCINAVNETHWDVNNLGVDPFRVNGDCPGGVPVPAGTIGKDGFYHYSAGMQHIFANKSLKQKTIKGIPPWKLMADVHCINATAVTLYLNSPYVRQALHIADSSYRWELCNATVDQQYVRQYPDMSIVYTDLLATYKYRILVYNGDQDSVYNYLGNQRFVANLHRQEEVQRRPWLYKNSLDQDQVAGFVMEYDDIAFLTIKNAGYWASRDQPVATEQLIYNFIYKRPF